MIRKMFRSLIIWAVADDFVTTEKLRAGFAQHSRDLPKTLRNVSARFG